MDANVDVDSEKLKFDRSKCALCGEAVKLFRIPSSENMSKKWFSILKWDVPPEKFKHVIINARICGQHFSDWCFTSTLKQRLIKFACPLTASPEPQNSSVEDCVVESGPSTEICSTTSSDIEIHQDVTLKTRLIKVLRSKNSKLKKKLYTKNSSARFLGQLKAKFANKPHLYYFILSQLKMQGRASKGRRWSPREKSFALQIYLQSPGTYKHLSQFFAFPSKSTVCRYTYNIAKSPGFCPNLIKCLKSQSSRMSESEKLCVLTFDEMAIKQELTYAADLDCIDGVTTVKHNLNDKIPHATHALVFMAKGIEKNWKQILGYHFTSCSEKYSLTELIYEAIDILESCELEVTAIVCDQGPTNQSLFRQLKITKDEPFFEHNSKKIYAIYDPPHLLKSVRNNLLNHGIYFEDKLAAEKPRTCKADWKHIKDLYEKDSKKRFSACRKLTKKHVEVSGLKKMNVKLAAQVLSHSVAAALDLYVSANEIENKATETATFVYHMDKLFDSVNSKSLQHEKKEMCGVTQNSFHVEFWKEKIAWIEKWFIRSSKTQRLIHPACKNGWLITLKAFIEISEILLQKLKFILPSRFSQDALENTFSTIRRRGGFRDHPNANEFRSTIQKVIISNFLKRSQSKNCQDDDTYNLIDFTCFNKKELLEILSTTDDLQDDKDKAPQDTDSLNLLDNIEENVLFYIAGYFAKKYLTLNECAECKKLIVDVSKILDNFKMFAYFKEYNINNTIGLRWPTNDFFQYFTNLYHCFLSNFNLLFERNNVCKKLCDILIKCEIDFLNDHVEHKDDARLFFVTSFVKLMVKHEIKKLSMKIHDTNLVTSSKKKRKYTS